MIVQSRVSSQACTKEAEKASWKGLRNLIKEDNHRAVDVGHLRKGMMPIHVRKPKFSEEGRSR